MPTFMKIATIFSLLGFCCGYDLGVRYHYKYHTEVAVNEDHCHLKNEEAGDKNLGYQIKSSVYITCVWESEFEDGRKVIKIELVRPKLLVPQKSSFKDHQSKLESFPQSSLYVEWVDGKVKTVFTDSTDLTIMKNLKKGIASLLQVQESPGEFSEIDISGKCLMHFEAGGRFLKTRKENCIHPIARNDLPRFQEIRSGNISSSSEIITELAADKSKSILSVEAKDFIKMQSNMWKIPTICITSKTNLNLEDEKSGSPIAVGENAYEAVKAHTSVNFVKDSLLADLVSNEHSSNCKNLAKSINNYKEALKTENLAKLKSATSFLKLLECFRLASKEDVISVIKNKKHESILPQLLDVIAASQTESSIAAVFEALDFLADDVDLPERYLLSASTVLHPNIKLVKAIMNVLSKKVKGKIQATLVMTLGALTKSCNKGKENRNDIILQDIEDFLVKELNSCNNVLCKTTYLRGLRNAGIPGTIPVLLKFIKNGGKPALEALLALKNIGVQYYNDEVLKVLQRAFYQIGPKQDSSSRAVAAELLLIGSNSRETLRGILSVLGRQDNPEFSTFVVSRLFHLIEKNEKLRYEIQSALADKDVNYYYTLSQKGSSASFSKPLIDAEGINATYHLELEMIGGGLLKHSSFSVNLHSPESNLHVISVGMFAEGLSDIVGGASESELEEKEETTAGMELTVLGVALRPYIFFQSSAELMGHVWSGTGSKPTPALQGNFLLIDDTKSVILQNGFTIQLKLSGCLSTDLSAFIEISIWNSNSHSVVKNAAALFVKGSAQISEPFISLLGEFSFKGQSAVDFTTDLKFYEVPYKMCLKMDQSDYFFRSDLRRIESIPGSKHLVKRIRKRKLYIPSKSYPLHRKNNEQCFSMFH